MSKMSYEEMCSKIKSKKCIPIFSQEEWQGVRKNGIILKYWFQDESGHNFYARYDNVASGHKTQCNECGKLNQLNKQKLSELEYKKYNESFILNKNIKILSKYDDYKNVEQKLLCKCLTCNNDFYENINNIIKKSSHGCIRMPHGEKIVISILEENAIKYNYQSYISELNLTSDFEIYLKNGNIIHLEIDGDQHYDFPNEFHKTYEDFLKSKNRDILKDEWYSKNNNINIHIRYNLGGKNNENLEEILYDIIKGKYGKCENKIKNSDFNIMDFSKNDSKCKKIIAYNLDGYFYKIYNSALEAEKDLNVDNSCISTCLNGRKNREKQGRAGNYMFRLYEDNFPLNIEPYKTSRCKIILIYKNDVIIEECNSLNEVSKKYEISRTNLCRYIKKDFEKKYKNIYNFKYK